MSVCRVGVHFVCYVRKTAWGIVCLGGKGYVNELLVCVVAFIWI